MTTSSRLVRRPLAGSIALVLVALTVAGLLVSPNAGGSSANPVTGTFTGPSVLPLLGHSSYTLNGTGGPAFAPNGTRIGNLSYYVSVLGTNLTGVSVAPASGAIIPGYPAVPTLTVGAAPEVLTVQVEITSVYHTQNESFNLTYTVHVVQPYVVSAQIVATTSVTVLSFPLVIDLDGTPVGTVQVPTLTPGQSYNLSYQYATIGLGPGEHTFTISLATEHGMVAFAGGATEYSSTFYVTGPGTDYTLWYVAGAVAFFGVLFIFATRVAARRRGNVRK